MGKAPQYHLLSSMYTLIQVRMCFQKVPKVLWGSCSLIMFGIVVESRQGRLGDTRAGPCVSLTGLLGLPHPALCRSAPLCVCMCIREKSIFWADPLPAMSLGAAGAGCYLNSPTCCSSSGLRCTAWSLHVSAAWPFFPYAHFLLPVFTWFFMPIYSQ